MKAIATPTTMVLLKAMIPINASAEITTLRGVHGSPDENHEKNDHNRYRISD